MGGGLGDTRAPLNSGNPLWGMQASVQNEPSGLGYGRNMTGGYAQNVNQYGKSYGWSPMPQGVSNYQQVLTPGAGPRSVGGVDIPPADMHDPFGGAREGLSQMSDPHMSSFFNQFFSGGFGNNPSSGQPISGGTIDPTFWSNNNTGSPNTFAPLGIPAGGWVDPAAGALPHNLYHAGQHLSNT